MSSVLILIGLGFGLGLARSLVDRFRQRAMRQAPPPTATTAKAGSGTSGGVQSSLSIVSALVMISGWDVWIDTRPMGWHHQRGSQASLIPSTSRERVAQISEPCVPISMRTTSLFSEHILLRERTSRYRAMRGHMSWSFSNMGNRLLTSQVAASFCSRRTSAPPACVSSSWTWQSGMCSVVDHPSWTIQVARVRLMSSGRSTLLSTKARHLVVPTLRSRPIHHRPLHVHMYMSSLRKHIVSRPVSSWYSPLITELCPLAPVTRKVDMWPAMGRCLGWRVPAFASPEGACC
mmetsp:Transcript_76530/g.127566  ORF Transcript_76530/g.127566 Transcript_76530/m.127566 type:complete len:290 (+) Transcript_76530:965-1834(+)